MSNCAPESSRQPLAPCPDLNSRGTSTESLSKSQLPSSSVIQEKAPSTVPSRSSSVVSLRSTVEIGQRYRYDPYSCSIDSYQSSSPVRRRTLEGAASLSTSRTSLESVSKRASIDAPRPLYASASRTDHGELSHTTLSQHFSDMQNAFPHHACTARGRFIVLALLRCSDVTLRTKTAEALRPYAEKLSCDVNGCHVLHRLIEMATEKDLEEILSYLTPQAIISMATGTQQTRRGLQALFEHHQTPLLDDVMAVLSCNIEHLGSHQQGCVALIRCLEFALPSQQQMMVDAMFQLTASDLHPTSSGSMTPPTVSQDTDSTASSASVTELRRGSCLFRDLSLNKYGNYVVQGVLRVASISSLTSFLTLSAHSMLLRLAVNKFGSNVVECLIRRIDTLIQQVSQSAMGPCPVASFPEMSWKQQPNVSRSGDMTSAAYRCRSIVTSSLLSTPMLHSLASDAFGNYVVQVLLETCASQGEFESVLRIIYPQLVGTPFAFKIEGKARALSRQWQCSEHNGWETSV